jgi:hypothetical protein
MRKFYFAPTPWSSSQQVFEDYRFQTPNNLGIWEDVQSTTNLNEAEFLVIQDECHDVEVINRFSPEKRLYFSREALSTHLKGQYPSSEYNRFSYWDGTGYLPLRWWYGSTKSASSQGYGGISMDYDQLINLQPPEKTKNLCCVLSNKEMTEGHRIRKKFTKSFLQKYSFDLFGSVEFRNSELKDNDKMSNLMEYKYSLGFDNQDFIKDFFGTQCTDTILAWTVPIFWCGQELSKYLPEGSFIQFNARDLNEIDRIIDVIENDDYQARIPALKEAREYLLNHHNFFPTIKKLIDNV